MGGEDVKRSGQRTRRRQKRRGKKREREKAFLFFIASTPQRRMRCLFNSPSQKNLLRLTAPAAQRPRERFGEGQGARAGRACGSQRGEEIVVPLVFSACWSGRPVALPLPTPFSASSPRAAALDQWKRTLRRPQGPAASASWRAPWRWEKKRGGEKKASFSFQASLRPAQDRQRLKRESAGGERRSGGVRLPGWAVRQAQEGEEGGQRDESCKGAETPSASEGSYFKRGGKCCGGVGVVQGTNYGREDEKWHNH